MRLTWYSVEKFAHIHLAKINKNSSYVNFHFVSSTRAHRLTLSLLRLHRVRFVSYMTDFKNTSPHIRIKRVHMRCMEDSNRKQKKKLKYYYYRWWWFFLSLITTSPIFRITLYSWANTIAHSANTRTPCSRSHTDAKYERVHTSYPCTYIAQSHSRHGAQLYGYI